MSWISPRLVPGLLLSLLLATFAGCATAPPTPLKQDRLLRDARLSLDHFKRNDPTLEVLLRKSYAVAVFPNVGKGGAGLGGAHGRGVVYRHGEPIGWTDLSQATLGFQLGGQSYRQLVLFRDMEHFDRFSRGHFALAAHASAIAADRGAAAGANWEEGVIVFILTRGGLMYEASIGGQKFRYEPMD